MINDVLNNLEAKDLYHVPVFPNSKQPEDKEWQKKKYQKQRYADDNSVGVNLKLSQVLHFDFETWVACRFGEKFCPKNTFIIGKKYEKNGCEIELVTNYFYKNNGVIDSNLTFKNDAGTPILELRCNGQSVVHGKTPLKEDNSIMCERYVVNDAKPASHDNLLFIANKIYLACMFVEYDLGMNEGALRLDGCLKRYCSNWSDDDRVEFLLSIGEVTRPEGRDTTESKMRRIVKSNNNNPSKQSGYRSLAQQLQVEPLKIKNLFKKIGGSIPQSDDYEKVKSIVDFNAKSINVEELMKKVIPPLKWSVLPIMPEGLGFISGRPKAMKSWTVLGICYAVQNGIKFMGHETTQGDVMYLALEDSERRIKDRIVKLGYHKLKHPTILLASDVPYLGFGFEECIESWIKDKENPRLIVIDTLARIKPRARKNSGTAYDMDNELLSKIQTIAIQNNITIACVTHLSKQQQDYSFDRIQGSVGIQGIADFMWMIDRGDNSNQASITGRGRDMNDFEYAVIWDEDKWQYEFTGNLQMVQLTENRRQVIDAMNFLTKEKDEIAPRDVCKYYQVSVQSKDGKRISKTMQRMEGDFELIKGQKFGTYKLPNKTEGKEANY